MEDKTLSGIQQQGTVGHRQMHLFTIPASLQGFGIKSIGLVELTAEEEIMATKRCANDVARLAFELAKESLRQVDGKPVSTMEGTVDRLWNRMHPKVRNLVVAAYGQIHQPEGNETAGFLASHQVQVG